MKATDLPDWEAGADLAVVGGHSSRVDGLQKVTGRAVYSRDRHLPGQLYAAVLRSPHPHARVAGISADAALEVPGVVAVLTADDAEGITWYEQDLPLFSDPVRFIGDEVAAVAATSVHVARQALARIVVDYEVLSFVTDPEHALEEGAPQVHENGNLSADVEVTQRGQVEQALADAAVVIEGTYRTPVAVHNALETHGCTASWDGEELTLYTSTQSVNDVRSMMAERLGLDHNQVRVVAEHIGGGFGAKQVPWKPTMLAALLSRKTGRPVHLFNDRRAENLGGGKRADTVQTVRLGADENGKLIAIDADLLAQVGAYGVTGEPSNVAGIYLHLYACDNVRTTSRKVYTHTGPSVAFRAPGYVEGTFALESAMDQLAGELGIDPIELRRRNYTERDQQQDLPWSAPQALRRCYERVSEVARWDTDLTKDGGGGDDAAKDDSIKFGRGFAAHEWMAGKAMPPGYAWMEYNADGSVHVTTSTQDIGTGTRTMLAQVAAEELALDPSRVRLTLGDTGAGPPAPKSAGSATTPTMAPAVRAAAADARQQILATAANQLQVDAASLTLAGEMITCTAEGTDDLAVADLLEELSPEGIHGHGGLVGTNENVSVRTFGSAVAEVAVDTLTGVVTVNRIVVAPDCGRILNRTMVDSQVIGGVTQGIGFALTEQQVVDHRLGVVLNDQLEDYLIPTVSDTCVIEHAEVDLPDLAANPLGVKGIGELPLIPVPAAIANAVHDAIGIRFTELPITPKRMLDALAAQDEAALDEKDDR